MDRTRSQTFARGLKVLADLNQYDGATTAEIAERLGLHRVIVDRLLGTLVAEGYVRREGRPARYHLRAEVQSLADGFVAEGWVDAIARPLVLALGRELVWPISLAVNAGTVMRVSLVTDPQSPLTRRKIPLGFRLPLLRSAAGHAFLAHADQRTRATLIALAEAEGQKLPAQFAAQIAAVRTRGYALWASPEKVVQIAVPVMVRRQPLGALAVRYFASALTPARAGATLAPPLRGCAAAIARALEGSVR